MSASFELLLLYPHEFFHTTSLFFSEDTFWSLYKWWLVGGFWVAIAQSLLIGWLVLSLIRRRSAQEALRASEELHRVILSNISDTVFITDDQGAFTFVCPNVHVIFGYSFDEVWSLGHITRLLGNDDFLPE